MKKFSILIALSLLALSGCAAKPTSEKLSIVATTSIIADLTENITQGLATVTSLVPVGVDPHSFEPLPSDSQAVANADLIFYNGFNLETGKGWFQNLLDATQQNERAFAVTENVTPIHLSNQEGDTAIDPHAWLDVRNAIKYVEVIAREIIALDPDNKETYLANKEAYIQELEALHQEIIDKANTIPEEQRFLVTSEGAFKYFAEAYNFTAAYIWEINTDNQGTPQQMNRLIEIIRNNNVPALFVETSINPQTMEAISNETGVPIHSKIFTDSLAPLGTEGDSYISMMRWNITRIVEGLTQE